MSETHAQASAGQRHDDSGRIRTGIGGWDFAPWRDTFYPAGLVKRRQLEYASRALATIEINSTFYRAQTAATYANWRDATPPGFVFALKAPRYLTHRKKLAGAGPKIAGFVEPLTALADRLGPINWQLPPTMAFDADDIAGFFAALPGRLGQRALRHAIEVRHPSFACTTFVELARAAGVAIVCTDSTDYPTIADVTADFIYARLMRSLASIETGYPTSALDAWAKRVEIWVRGGAPDDLPRIADVEVEAAPRDVFVYFINGAKPRAPAAAMAMAALVGSKASAV